MKCLDLIGSLTSCLEISVSSSESDSRMLADGKTTVMAFDSSFLEEGAVAPTGFTADLLEDVAEGCLPFLAARASARVKVLYPLPKGKPVGHS